MNIYIQIVNIVYACIMGKQGKVKQIERDVEGKGAVLAPVVRKALCDEVALSGDGRGE